MKSSENKAVLSKPNQSDATPAYQRPELKKHGKLKNKASQQIVTYTYGLVLG